MTTPTPDDIPTFGAAAAAFVEVKEPPLSPYRYGFKGDGSTNDTAALQDALNALPQGGAMDLPHEGNALLTSPLQINVPGTTIRGRASRNQRLYFNGCDGFHVAAGVGDVKLSGFELVTNRHTTTPNTLVGVKALGTDANRNHAHIYRDLFLDGFKTAFQVGYMWESLFSKVDCSGGALGLDVYGLSINNTVDGGSNIVVNNEAGSRAVRFQGIAAPGSATEVASEGWAFVASRFFGGQTGVELTGVRWFDLSGCVIDGTSTHGILVNSNTTLFGGNHQIRGNYIAVDSGTAAIRVLNQLENPARSRNVIADNELYGYGSGCTYGVLLDGAYSGSIVHGNKSHGMTAQDVNVSATGSKVYGNELLSSAAPNLYTSATLEAFGNSGVISADTDDRLYMRGPTGRRELAGTATPAGGTWAVGDRKRNTGPAVGSPKGWTCTVAGTPGTWVSEGNL